MYTRELNENERMVLNHLVELCCEAYLQEAKICRINFVHSQLRFSAQTETGWSLIEQEELTLAEYNEIVQILQGIFEAGEKQDNAVKDRIVTVTLDCESDRPIMNLWLSFHGKKTDYDSPVIELTIEDLAAQSVNRADSNTGALDTRYIN